MEAALPRKPASSRSAALGLRGAQPSGHMPVKLPTLTKLLSSLLFVLTLASLLGSALLLSSCSDLLGPQRTTVNARPPSAP